MKIDVLINQIIRLLKIAAKPSDEEYKKIARVVGSLMFFLGFLGLLVSIFFSLI